MSTKPKLPELPLAVALWANLNHDQTWNGMPCEPHYSFHPCDCGWEEHFSTRGIPIEGLFSAEQVRAIMLQAVNEERERCAMAVEAAGPKEGPLKLVTEGFASVIRSLPGPD